MDLENCGDEIPRCAPKPSTPILDIQHAISTVPEISILVDKPILPEDIFNDIHQNPHIQQKKVQFKSYSAFKKEFSVPTEHQQLPHTGKATQFTNGTNYPSSMEHNPNAMYPKPELPIFLPSTASQPYKPTIPSAITTNSNSSYPNVDYPKIERDCYRGETTHKEQEKYRNLSQNQPELNSRENKLFAENRDVNERNNISRDEVLQICKYFCDDIVKRQEEYFDKFLREFMQRIMEIQPKPIKASIGCQTENYTIPQLVQSEVGIENLSPMHTRRNSVSHMRILNPPDKSILVLSQNQRENDPIMVGEDFQNEIKHETPKKGQMMSNEDCLNFKALTGLPSPSTDRSLAVNALAMKYLPKETFQKLNEKHNVAEAPLSGESYSSELGFYMAKYDLLNKNTNEKTIHHRLLTSSPPKQIINSTKNSSNQPTPIPNRFLDVEAIKRQPKLIYFKKFLRE